MKVQVGLFVPVKLHFRNKQLFPTQLDGRCGAGVLLSKYSLSHWLYLLSTSSSNLIQVLFHGYSEPEVPNHDFVTQSSNLTRKQLQYMLEFSSKSNGKRQKRICIPSLKMQIHHNCLLLTRPLCVFQSIYKIE